DVLAAMPDLDERLALAERTLTALVADAELPPKIGVHPRPAGSFAHAMPAHLRGADPAGRDDQLGMKWVAGFATNNELGLPAISGIGEVTVASDAHAAVRNADVVVTAASFGPVRQVMTGDWLAPNALVVPVDYATYCAAEVAETAALFIVDDRGQFLANRDAG